MIAKAIKHLKKLIERGDRERINKFLKKIDIDNE